MNNEQRTIDQYCSCEPPGIGNGPDPECKAHRSSNPPGLRGDKKCPHGHTARRKCNDCTYEDDQREIERLTAELAHEKRMRKASFDDSVDAEAEIARLRAALESALRHEDTWVRQAREALAGAAVGSESQSIT